MVTAPGNPYPPLVTDESSAICVPCQKHEVWNDGWWAGWFARSRYTADVIAKLLKSADGMGDLLARLQAIIQGEEK